MRLIDADALSKRITIARNNADELINNTDSKIMVMAGINSISKLIDNSPTVDAVPVVRCSECRWYDKSTASGTYEPIAYKCKLHQRFTIGIQFCSDGEREENAVD